MPKVVISYRRSDSDAVAGRIRDRLAGHFGDDCVFMDIDNIPIGSDFREHIRGELFGCDVVIVLVGLQWLGPGNRERMRIHDASDPVRIELETALQEYIPIVPVLVNGARMPAPSELPESLQDFAFRNAAQIDTGRDFHPHVDRLIRSLERIVGASKPQQGRVSTSASNRRMASASFKSPIAHILAWRHLVVAAVCLLATGFGVAYLVIGRPATPTDGPKVVKTVTVKGPLPPGCTDKPVTLDETRIPKVGTAMRDSMTAAITEAFRCGTAPFDHWARVFAAISIVVPVYLRDAACFGGDSGALNANWKDHKVWADRQERADALAANLSRKIEQAIACLGPDDQRLFFVDVARAFTAATTGATGHVFTNPTLRGVRIDRCLYYERECNEPAAFAWCQRFGYSRLVKWAWVYTSSTTTLGDGGACKHEKCGAFSTITCAR
jgi:hypothetical protein